MSKEKCLIAASEVVWKENILDASRMNSAVVMFINTVIRANKLAKKGIVIVITPQCVSNFYPFQKSYAIKRATVYHRRLKELGVEVNRTHSNVISFRRFAYDFKRQ